MHWENGICVVLFKYSKALGLAFAKSLHAVFAKYFKIWIGKI